MSYIAERREQEKERRRAEILDAAEAVAAEVGIEAMTMEQVARKARLSRALLYVYFADKTDLHMGLCERALVLLHRRFEEAIARQRIGLDRVRAIARAYTAFSLEFPVYFEALARFEAHETVTVGEGHAHSCIEASRGVHGVTVRAIESGVADGSVRADLGDALGVAITLWGFMFGVLQIVRTKPAALALFGLTSEALIERAVAMCEAMLAAKR